MQSCRAGFLRAGENEIEPHDLAALWSKQGHPAPNRARAHARCRWSFTISSKSTSMSKRAVVALTPPSYGGAMSKFFRASLFVLGVALKTSVSADEGMWLFNAPTLKQLKEKYQF